MKKPEKHGSLKEWLNSKDWKNPLMYREKRERMILFIASIGFILGIFTKSLFILMLTAFVLTAIILLDIVFWKCPHCKHSLPRFSEGMKTCPYCGKPLSDSGEGQEDEVP